MSFKNSAVRKRQEDLRKYEETIASAARGVLAMGKALGRIRADGLYKEAGFETFEVYVEQRHEITRRTADRLIGAARVVHALGPIGLKIKNEAMARELVPFGSDGEKMLAVVTAAEARAGKLTAALLKEVREELYPETRVIEGEWRDSDRLEIEGGKTDHEVADEVAQATASFDEKYSGDAPSPPVGVPGQTVAEAFSDISATADDGEGHAFQPADPSAGDGLARDEPVPGNPLDPPADPPASDMPVEVPVAIDQPGSSSPLARGEAPSAVGAARPPEGEEPGRLSPAAPEEPALSSGAQNLTDGQTRSLPGNVQPPAKPGVDSAGGTAGEGSQAGTEDPFPADPASEFMATWRSFISSFGTRDLIVIAPMLTDDEYGELEDDYTFLGQRLAKMRNASP